MDCRRFLHDLYAHSDGLLDPAEAAEAQRHLAGCAACQSVLEVDAELKASLARCWNEESVSTDLRARIRGMLATREAVAQEPSLGGCDEGAFGVAGRTSALRPTADFVAGDAGRFDCIPEDARRRQFRPVRGALAGLTAAAVMALVATAWWLVPSGRGRPVIFHPLPTSITLMVIQQHRVCTLDGGLNHHDPSLPRDAGRIGPMMSSRLGLTVLAPDLSSDGFDLVGCRPCGLGDRAGAHVLYRSGSTGTMLSWFCVGRFESLVQPNAEDRRHYFEGGDGTTRVIAWNRGRQSYVVCSPLPRDRLLALVQGVRVADGGVMEGHRAALAAIR